MQLTRKEFLKTALALAGVPVAVGCGSDDGSGDAAGSGGTGGSTTACTATGGDISSNHGHSLTVPRADVDAGMEKIYSLGGPHDHEIVLGASDFASLRSGSVTVTSGMAAGHTHSVTIRCA